MSDPAGGATLGVQSTLLARWLEGWAWPLIAGGTLLTIPFMRIRLSGRKG